MNSYFTVIVNFETMPDEQSRALELIGSYVGTFLSQQPGFISGRLHGSIDGKRIVNYAQWESEGHFKAFADKASSHPDLPEIRKYKPEAGFFEVWKQY
jgi:heme-degrading monooxygenase HmoA